MRHPHRPSTAAMLSRLSGLLLLCLSALCGFGCYELRDQGLDDDDNDSSPTGDDDSASPGDDDDDSAMSDDDDDDDATPDEGPLGFIGSPCTADVDCDFDDGVCLLDGDGFPGGTCSQGCDLYCPDRDGHPTTFCVEEVALLAPAAALGDGACLSRCDLGLFPDSGCRPGYGCRVESRANEPGTQMYACLPGEDSDLSSCHIELAERGVSFEPTVRADSSPSTHPDLICHIEEPVWVQSPVLGTELLYYDGNPTDRVLASCDMAHSLADTILDVQPLGVTALLHIGTYNCRVIANVTPVRLSRHGYGDAIDIYGFDFADGTSYTLVDHWEGGPNDNPPITPVAPGGMFLSDAAQRWHDEQYWSIILTPNYNMAHDNHFHVDLTPGSDFLEVRGTTFIGPAPYYD